MVLLKNPAQNTSNYTFCLFVIKKNHVIRKKKKICLKILKFWGYVKTRDNTIKRSSDSWSAGQNPYEMKGLVSNSRHFFYLVLFESNKFYFIQINHFFKSKKVIQSKIFFWFNEIFILSVKEIVLKWQIFQF